MTREELAKDVIYKMVAVIVPKLLGAAATGFFGALLTKILIKVITLGTDSLVEFGEDYHTYKEDLKVGEQREEDIQNAPSRDDLLDVLNSQ